MDSQESPSCDRVEDRSLKGLTWKARRSVWFLPIILGVALFIICSVILSGIDLDQNEPDFFEKLPEPEGLLSLKNPPQTTGVNQPPKQSNVCLKRSCVHAASRMIKMMDESADPCEDFYEFSCGTYVRKTIIPEKKSSLLQHSLLQDELNVNLRLSLNKSAMSQDPQFVKMAKSLYKECINSSKIESQGLTPLKQIISQFGGWPVVKDNAWNSKDFSWIKIVNISRQLGYSHSNLIGVDVDNDLTNSSIRTLYVDQPTFGISREYLVNGKDDPQVAAYLKYSIMAAILLGADPLKAKQQMEQAVDLQIALANISAPREDRRNYTKLNNKMPIAELSSLSPDIPWLDYLQMLLPSSVQIDENEMIIAKDINYIKNFSQICRSASNRTIANYLIWRVVQASAPFLSEEIRALELDYLAKLSGITTREPRWEECVKFVSGRVPLALGSIYIRNFFDEESKQRSIEIFEYIEAEFSNILHSLPWMDEITRQAAQLKASLMKSHIAYPSELLDNSKLNNFYGKLFAVRGANSHLNDALRTNKFNIDFDQSELQKPVNKSDWKLNGKAAVVNAFYDGSENSMKFPAGFLQGVFFGKDKPRYLNFGALGYVVGHEITHGFDDQGKQFDHEGNLNNWWQQKTQDEFNQRAKCIIWQYGNYTAPEIGLKLNGVNTQGENIADNGGIKEAYHAYLKWTSDNGEELPLPGFENYTTRQLFWLSFAQLHCSKYKPDAMKQRILTGYHSPGRFRAIGPVTNREEFAQDWKCRINSKMNPSKKCQIW